MEHSLLNSQRGALFLHTPVQRAALPRRSCESTMQPLDLAMDWSGGLGVQSLHSYLVAPAAGIYTYLKMHAATEEQWRRTLLRCCKRLKRLSTKCTRPCCLYYTVKSRVRKQRSDTGASLNQQYLRRLSGSKSVACGVRFSMEWSRTTQPHT